MSAAYAGDDAPLIEILAREHGKYDNIEIFLTRTRLYNPKGRMQTEEEAKEKDVQIKNILDSHGISYVTYPGSGPDNSKEIADYIMSEMTRRKDDNT